MPSFDVLSERLPLFQNYFIEASAGTGKTFAIEHLVAKLLMHPEGPEIDQILVVTFTRAAVLELKARIRSTLEAYFNKTTNPRLSLALASFDEARILTLHSFCFQSLREHALEAGIPLDLDEESAPQERLHEIARDFFRTAPPAHDQLEILLGAHQGDFEKLISALLQTVLSEERPQRSEEEIKRDWQRCVALLSLKKEPLLEDLKALAFSYRDFCDRKRTLKAGRCVALEKLAVALCEDSPDPTLLLFHPTLKLKRDVDVTLHYPPLLEMLLPLADELYSRENVMIRAAARLHTFVSRAIDEQDLLFYDDLLKKMEQNVASPTFAQSIRSQYRAALIDEFQDTDPIQWSLFSTLFFHKEFTGPVYVVGDPKQAIYRFRNADIYTYLAAKKQFGDSACVSLARNWRSSPALVRALNFLFTSIPDFFPLPKWNEALSCPPVEWDPTKPPESGHLEFCLGNREEDFFPYLFDTIATLNQKHNIPLSECAILVKDRYQAERLLRFAKSKKIPALTTKSRSLAESPALPTLIEWLEALLDPLSRSAALRLLAGPLFQGKPEELPSLVELLYTLSPRLDEQGVLATFLAMMQEYQVGEKLLAKDGGVELYSDCLQLIELVAREAPLIHQALPYLRHLTSLHPETEKLKARPATSEEAVQILTIHVSKGLEFDAVFPIGLLLPAPAPKDDLEAAEADAEKMRALYVALTRARSHLFVPVLRDPKRGSPLHLFFEKWLKGRALEDVVGEHEAISVVEAERSIGTPRPTPSPTPLIPPSPLTLPRAQGVIHSFTSLAQAHIPASVTLPEGALPAGVETGRLLHRVFEEISFNNVAPNQIASILEGTHLEAHISSVVKLVQEALSAPLNGFTLSEVAPEKIAKEMEFLMYGVEGDYLKGFIDLFFEHAGAYYLLDWKTNVLENYDQKALAHAMEAHDYFLQARIYAGAVRRYLNLFGPATRFGGTFYVFLRGLPDGIYFIEGEGTDE